MMVKIDLNGELVHLDDAVAAAARDAAAADAARSSARRDLSLILDRALESGTTIALRRAEMRELAALLDEHPEATQFDRLRQALAERRQ